MTKRPTHRVSSSPSSPPPEGGTVLIALLVLVIALVTFGIAHLETLSIQHSIQGASFRRLQARAIGEGGIEVAYFVLVDVPGITGTYHYDLGEDPNVDLDIRISSTAGGYEIVCLGTVGDISAGYVSLGEGGSGTISVRETLLVGTDLIADKASILEWGGKALYLGKFEEKDGGVGTGVADKFTGFSTPITINPAPFSASGTLLPSGTLGGGVLTGVLYCPGNLVIEGNLELHGTLLVDGDLTFRDGTVAISTDAGPTTLMVRGDLAFQDIDVLTVSGAIFAEGNVLVERVAKFELVGNASLNGNFQVKESQGNVEFDPAILEKPPKNVSGGIVRQELRERSRYPTTDMSLLDP